MLNYLYGIIVTQNASFRMRFVYSMTIFYQCYSRAKDTSCLARPKKN